MSTGRLGASNSKLGILVLGSPNTEFSGGFGQATALIDSPIKVQSATAQAFILKAKGLGQAQARIYAFNYPQFGQAQAKINAFGVQAYAQAAAWIAYTPGPNDGPHIQRIYRSNPLAVYRLGESSGATAVNAAHTGNGTYGGTITYSEAHTIEGDTDTAIAIGSSGNMTATVSSIPVTNGQPVTVAFWMHWSGTSDQMPFAWDVSYSDLYFNPGGTFGFNTGAGDTYGFSSSGLANKWVWVVAVFYHNQNYTTASKIYINGLSQTLSGSSATHTVGTSFRLSGWSAGGQHFVGSKVDDLVIWGREPSSAEILDIYNSSIPKQFAQAQALIIITKSGQAAALIDSPIKVQFGQAQAKIAINPAHAQAQARIGHVGQFKSEKTRNSIGSPIVLPYTPAVGNKLILTYAQRDGGFPPSITGFTLIGYDSNDSRSQAAMYYRDVQSGDTASWAFPSIDNDGRVTIVEANSLPPGPPSYFVTDNNNGTITTAAISGSEGLLIGVFANELSITLGSGLTLIDQGPVYEDVNPNQTTYFKEIVTVGSYTGSSTGSAGNWGSVLAYWGEIPIKFGQAMAHILGNTGYAQAQAQIKTFNNNKFAQAQAFILEAMVVSQLPVEILYAGDPNLVVSQLTVEILYSNAVQAYGQAQAQILGAANAFAQAQADIKQTYQAYSQAQADIKQTYNAFSQAQADIKQVYNAFAQAQALITGAALAFAQAQADIKQIYQAYSQAQAQIKQTYQAYAQAQALIGQRYQAYAQAQGSIKAVVTSHAQAQADIKQTYFAHSQAQADILQTYQGYAQAQAQIVKGTRAYAQAQGAILATVFGFAQAQADIKQIYYGFAQAQAQIAIYSWGFGQAQGDILATSRGYAQAQAFIDSYTLQFAQARALIDSPVKTAVGQTQAVIIRNKHAHAQAQGFIDSGTYSAYGLAQAYITFRGTFGQAEAYIIKLNNRKYAQAQARVIGYYNKHAQAQAMIAHKYATGQSQAIIQLTGRLQTGLAQAQITNRFPVGQAQAMIRSQRYLVMYNKYQLPGYAQGEAFNSPMKIVAHPTAYNDISFTEYLGLENKSISIRMLVTGETYLACKNQIQDAGTIIRSNRKGFAPLYVQAYDKHYEALGTSIKFEASVANIRSAEYTLEFEAKPWLISDTLTTISGTALVETTGRDLYNGTWTPTTIQVTGTNVTISGYTATGDFTGFVSISGAVNNLIINTDEYEATINGVNSTRVIRNVDYAIYVGPGMTYFDINGATDCVITYHDRWNL